MIQNKNKKSQPKPEFTTTTLNSNRTISTKAIHHNPAPNPEPIVHHPALPRVVDRVRSSDSSVEQQPLLRFLRG